MALAFASAYAALTGVLLVVGVLLTGPVVGANWTVEVDLHVARWLANTRTDVVDGVARVVSSSTSTPAVIAVATAVGMMLVVLRRWPALTVVLTGLALELAVYVSVTYAVARPRPDVALGDLPVTGSFPSGHAAMSVVLWGSVVVALRWIDDRRPLTAGAIATVAALAFAVGGSRLLLGLHYLTDVVVGWLLGIAVLAVALVLGRTVELATTNRWPDESDPASTRRRVARTATAVAVPFFALVVWGFAIEPRFVLATEELHAEVTDLPDEWSGTRVAVIADLQVGMWLDNVGMARQAVEQLVEQQPDVVLVLGDFVYGEDDAAQNVRTAVGIVADLPAAGIPTFAVLGNHDYDAGASELLLDQLPAAGIEVLRNEAVPLTGADRATPLWIVGIGPELPGRARPERAFADVPPDAARVVMMHNPATFGELEPGVAPLAVAGHTHGGQMRLPFLPDWSYLQLVEHQPVHADGWIDGYGAPGNRLFVNRGIGMSAVPLRINCSPAVSVFELAPNDTSG